MKIIEFQHYDNTAARIFTILRALERVSWEFTPRERIRTSLRSAWLESPTAPEGVNNFDKAIKQAKTDGLLVTERGPGGGCRITPRGRARFFSELAARKYLNARILRKDYRALLWPQPPAAPALLMAA